MTARALMFVGQGTRNGGESFIQKKIWGICRVFLLSIQESVYEIYIYIYEKNIYEIYIYETYIYEKTLQGWRKH